MELRARIDVLRREAGLARFRWTDPELRARVTPVRLAHLVELREALVEAYATSSFLSDNGVGADYAVSWLDVAGARVGPNRPAIRLTFDESKRRSASSTATSGPTRGRRRTTWRRMAAS